MIGSIVIFIWVIGMLGFLFGGFDSIAPGKKPSCVFWGFFALVVICPLILTVLPIGV